MAACLFGAKKASTSRRKGVASRNGYSWTQRWSGRSDPRRSFSNSDDFETFRAATGDRRGILGRTRSSPAESRARGSTPGRMSASRDAPARGTRTPSWARSRASRRAGGAPGRDPARGRDAPLDRSAVARAPARQGKGPSESPRCVLRERGRRWRVDERAARRARRERIRAAARQRGKASRRGGATTPAKARRSGPGQGRAPRFWGRRGER